MKTLYHKTKQAITPFFKYFFSRSGFSLMVMVLLLLVESTGFATDMLSGVKKDVNDNFGSGSTFMYILLVVELVSSVAMYMKNKNILTLAVGLPVVMLVTATGFTLIGA